MTCIIKQQKIGFDKIFKIYLSKKIKQNVIKNKLKNRKNFEPEKYKKPIIPGVFIP